MECGPGKEINNDTQRMRVNNGRQGTNMNRTADVRGPLRHYAINQKRTLATSTHTHLGIEN